MLSRVLKFPGKVLLAGGYGVLEKNNCGLVLAVGCYFYACYSQQQPNETQNKPSTVITVESRQIEGKWSYRYDWETAKLIELFATSPNNFVREAIEHSLRYFSGAEKMKGRSYCIHLLFDQGFLSTPNQSTARFRDFGGGVAHKTGLGSSGCVVVAVVAMMCLINQRLAKQLVDQLSQIANLAAQGKLGSNFDISSAVYGSHLYTNVLPQLAHSYLNTKGVDRRIFDTASIVQPIFSSPKLRLYMLDLHRGSNTREMVGSFTQKLKFLSESLQIEFFKESKAIVLELATAYQKLDISCMRALNKRHRSLQQQYSSLTGVEIEPKELRELMDELSRCEDTAYVICPGSGGYDAICWLTTAPDTELMARISTWKLSLRHLAISDTGTQQANEQDLHEVEAYLHIKH